MLLLGTRPGTLLLRQSSPLRSPVPTLPSAGERTGAVRLARAELEICLHLHLSVDRSIDLWQGLV